MCTEDFSERVPCETEQQTRVSLPSHVDDVKLLSVCDVFHGTYVRLLQHSAHLAEDEIPWVYQACSYNLFHPWDGATKMARD
jgi:hypothetical protein